MASFLKDLRYGARALKKSPGSTAVAVLSLALGIGANTTVFSWIDAVLVHPLPGIADAGRVVAFETVAPNGEFITNSYPDYRDYRDHLKLVSGLAAATPSALAIGEAEHLERIWGELVSGNYFAVLGVKPVLGRGFLEEEYGDKPGAYPVCVISHRLWRTRFASDPSIAGRTIRVNRYELTVVGVAPPDFRGTLPGLAFDIWAPLMMGPQLNGIGEWMLRDRKTRNLVAFARLNPGVSVPQARAEIAGLARELARRYPYENGGMSATVMPVWQSHFGAHSVMLTPLRILMAVCGVLLLIVCANVANLLLARSSGRTREFSIRLALGCSRRRLIRQLLGESLLLAVAGVVLALPLALLMSRSLGYLLPPTAFPVELHIALNADILAFAAAACVAAALLSGVAPALHSTRTDLSETLKEGGRGGSAGARSHRTRGLLVISEVGLALIALIGAGLFARSFENARRIQPGFDPANVLVSHFYLSTSGYSLEQRKQFCRRLRDQLAAAPGITAVSYADDVPLLGGMPWEDLEIEGYVPRPAENLKIYRAVVAPGYFDLLRIPLVDGRDFTEHDDENSLQVMIVNQTFARRFFAGANPIGRHVRGWGRWFTVVGVVRDSKYLSITEPARPYFYVPFRQVYRADLGIVFYMKVHSHLAAAAPLLRQQVRSIDPNVGVFATLPLAEYINFSLYTQKLAAMLLAVLGGLALLLAAIGLYGVMAYSVSQRTHEVGIRMALGAQPAHVLRMVIGQGMLLAAAGLGAGAAGALAVTRLVRSALVGTSATDPAVFVAAALFLAAVAALASFLPARRATRVDPNDALRYE